MVLVDNHWKIAENESVDTVIARVQASDNDENDVLTFGLESADGAENESLPFRINRDTGVVYLNESLEGRGGENFLLYVTVTDGTYNAKNGVFVNIKPKNSPKSNGPFLPNTKNATHLLPPFHSLPGVPTRSYPNFTLPPIYNKPGYHQTKTYPEPTPTSSGEQDTNDQQSSKTNATATTNKMPNGTDTIATQINTTQSVNGSRINNNTTMGTAGNGTDSESTVFPRTALKTILPIAIIAGGVIVASALIVSSFLFRKRLCAIGKSLKNKSKEEMAKKSNQSNSSTVMMSSISEDSRNSMVMQHWNGPTAFNNRYVPWDRENAHTQVNYTQYYNISEIVGE